MRDKIIKQFLARVKEENRRECVSENNKEVYQQFGTACKDFKKLLAKQAGKEQTPEMLEAVDKIIKTYTDCFFDLAYRYYNEGYCKGLCFAMKYLESK